MKKKMVIMNKYDNIVCELQSTGMFYKVKDDDISVFKMLEEGDEFRVVAIDVEEEVQR